MSLVLVTGASTGLGLAAAEALARLGHEVVLHARSRDKIADASVEHRMRELVFGDLADLQQTVALASQLNSIARFDAVIHNAGVNTGGDILAVNVVAPYVLSALMTPPARAILLSSSMHRSGSTDLDGIDFADATSRRRPYEDSKLCETALAMALVGTWPESMVHAVDPGWVPTRMGGPAAPDALDEGHRSQVWLAVDDQARITPRTGGYWFHRAVQNPHPAAHDARFQHDLLQRLQRHTGIALV